MKGVDCFYGQLGTSLFSPWLIDNKNYMKLSCHKKNYITMNAHISECNQPERDCSSSAELEDEAEHRP